MAEYDDDEMRNDFINDFAFDNDNDNDNDGMDLTMDPFAQTILINMYGNNYYKKKSLSQPKGIHSSVNMWNYLYGNQTGRLLRLPYDAKYIDKYDNFPELGIEVPQPECAQACIIAQQKLNAIGLYHTDLNNCTNVRKVGDDYYPIDTDKIVMMTPEEQHQLQQLRQQQQQQQPRFGGKKRKSKKTKKRKSKKTKKNKYKKYYKKY